MKFPSFLLIAFIVKVNALFADLTWHTDYAQAQALSLKDTKPILLFFNGSDWSGEAMWLKKEVLRTPSFDKKMEECCVCVEVDFPEHSQQSQQVANQNLELKKRFQVQETPTLLLLDSQERIIAKICYLPESGLQCAEDILTLINKDATLLKGLANLEQADLITLYQIAQELSRESAQEHILEAGLKTKDPYFLLEKYRFCVEKGEREGSEALNLKANLASLDPGNRQGIHFTLALIDFQDLSQRNSQPDRTVQPLVSYIEQFGSQDESNLWRLEMMIAQHYMEGDFKEKALHHAEKALQAAPSKKYDEIAHSLDYIRTTCK